MKNRWSDQAAAEFVARYAERYGEPLALRLHLVAVRILALGDGAPQPPGARSRLRQADRTDRPEGAAAQPTVARRVDDPERSRSVRRDAQEEARQ